MENKIILKKIDQEPFVKSSEKFGWIEWNEDSTFKAIHDKPGIDRSLILDPHRMSYTWMTSVITEIISETENEIEFKTKNSHYRLLINC